MFTSASRTYRLWRTSQQISDVGAWSRSFCSTTATFRTQKWLLTPPQLLDRIGKRATIQTNAGYLSTQETVRRFSVTSRRSNNNAAVQIGAANIGDVLSNYDTLLLDCDGVLWANDHFTKFTGISETINELRTRGKQLYFVTNNSLHARETYLKKFRTLAGFDAEKEHVFGVAYAAALYLKNIAKIQGKCYLIGSQGMATELEEVGIPYFGLGPDVERPSIHPDDLMAMHLDPQVEAVLVGFDEYFSYNKIFKAASYLSNPKCHYVATNDLEKALQLSTRHRQPLTGAIIPPISVAASREPVVLGKPLHHLLDCIQSQVTGLDLSRTLMIGDSIKTDIAFAHTIGVDSLLVMTGSTTESQLRKYEQLKQNVPTYYIESFSRLGHFL